jgi:hypothetical protein
VDIRTGEEGLLLPIKAICAGHVAVWTSRLNEEGIQIFFLMEDFFLHLCDVFHTRFPNKFQQISLFDQNGNYVEELGLDFQPWINKRGYVYAPKISPDLSECEIVRLQVEIG